MHAQTREREERLLHAVPVATEHTTAVIAVAGGRGNRRLFESLGARVVDGGRTMNPSTAELLAAVEADPAPEAVILPNDRNVQMAAEHAAENASKPVRVVPTVSLQAGLAAMVAFDAAVAADENAESMQEAAEDVATGAVTVASRDVETNGLAVSKGAWLGLADGLPVAGGESFEDVTRAVLARMLAEPRSVLTLLTGEEPPMLDGVLAELKAGHPGLELEVHEGGQPHYALLISAE
jgi:dihydroxyacetone kinase-like predicted kinase